MPVSSGYRLGAQVFSDVETLRMNRYNSQLKNDSSGLPYGSDNTHTIPRMDPLGRSKAQVLRLHSPTFERLAAVRTKLDKYVTSVPNTISANEQPISTIHEEAWSSDHATQLPTRVRVSSSLSRKRIRPQKELTSQALDKITYEETRTQTGNLKQKCSVEIWLPNVCANNDDENSIQTISRDSTTIEKSCQPMPFKSHQSSTYKISTITANGGTKSLDEISSKTSEVHSIPHVQHHFIDRSEKRSRSNNTSSTAKSISCTLNKNIKRSHARRLSSSTKSTLQSARSGISTASKTALPDITQTYSAPRMKGAFRSNDSMMTNSSARKTNKKLTRTKEQAGKTRETFKYNAHIMKESTSHSSANHPKVAVKILLGNNSPLRSTNDYNIIDAKLLRHRSSNSKSSTSIILPETHLISMVENYRASVSNLLVPLPAVSAKKNDDLFRSTPSKIPSPLTILRDKLENVTRASNSNTSEHFSERSLLPSSLILRSRQQHITQPFLQHPNSVHTSTADISTTKKLVYLKYSKANNTRYNYLVPK